MRPALPLLLLLLVPTAAAASVWLDAPAEASQGLPFDATVCAQGAPGARVEVRAWMDNGTVSTGGAALRPKRYDLALDVDRDGRACAALTAGPGMDARTTLHARLRDGSEARAEVSLALTPAPPLRLVDAWGAPFSGVRLQNDGAAPLDVGDFGLEIAGRNVALPDATIAPGEAIFLGATPPPGLRYVEAALAMRAGPMRLMLAQLPVDALDAPKLGAGEFADARGARRAGVERAAAEPMRVEGRTLVYATPDAGVAHIVALLDGAREEILLEGYTLTSADVAAALARALDRGVRVRMLIEGAPAGGIPEDEGAILALLAARGADVALMSSADAFPTRFATQHAKVIVVDREAALVATENLHASSYPADPAVGGTRGYGVVIWNASLAHRLARTLEADMAPWPDARRVDLDELPPPALAAPSAAVVAGETLALPDFAANVTIILSPDDPLALARAIGAARRSVDVQLLFAQPRFGADANPFLDALLDAARRNVTVRLLLDARVDDGRNREVVARLNAVAGREGLPLEARLDTPARLLHAKMVVLDEERAYVGSMNWGRASAHDNREAGLILDAPEVAAWLTLAFEEDWEKKIEPPEEREVPAPGLPAALLALAFSARRRARGRPSSARGGGRTRS